MPVAPRIPSDLNRYIAHQRAMRLSSQAAVNAAAIADLIGTSVHAAVIRVTGAPDPTGRVLIAGGAVAAQLASLGSVAGPYGTAIGAAVGFTAGAAAAAQPTDANAVAQHFGDMLESLTPGVRMRLWPYFRRISISARHNHGATADLGQWRTIDGSEPSAGTNQTGQSMVQSMMEGLMYSDWLPVHAAPAQNAAFDSLDWPVRYCIGIIASLVNDGQGFGNSSLAHSIASIGTDLSDLDPSRGHRHTELAAWVQANANMDAKHIRTALQTTRRGLLAPMADMTHLPNDPCTLALITDVAVLR